MANAGDKEDSWERGYKELDVLYQRTRKDLKYERARVAALEAQVVRLRREIEAAKVAAAAAAAATQPVRRRNHNALVSQKPPLPAPPAKPEPAPPAKPEVLSYFGRDWQEGPDGRSAAASRGPRKRKAHLGALLQQLQQLREN